MGVIGTFNFKGMIAAGFLNSTGGATDGMDYRYDNCSQTVGILFDLMLRVVLNLFPSSALCL